MQYAMQSERESRETKVIIESKHTHTHMATWTKPVLRRSQVDRASTGRHGCLVWKRGRGVVEIDVLCDRDRLGRTMTKIQPKTMAFARSEKNGANNTSWARTTLPHRSTK
jgi:hypothetical protein